MERRVDEGDSVWPRRRADEDERLLLLELLVDPPPGGDSFESLSRALDRPVQALHAAAAELERKGLVVVRGDCAVASPVALAFDELWPISL